MNNDYRLQLLSHGEIFSTREEAIEYITDNAKGELLWSEPALFFYGSERDPKMILVVGASHDSRRPKLCIIDDWELRELISEVSAKVDINTENIAANTANIFGIINSVGLTYDDNKITDKISYDPDSRDQLINEAETVAEAIAIISTFVQAKLKELQLTVVDGKSIDFDFTKTEEGSTLTGEVKISTDGDDDDIDFNNNIVGLKPDGLFASCNIEYIPELHRLIFTTSGMKNGRFVTDANKKIIDFGEHTIYTADNEDHTVNVTINQERGTISADVKISSDDDNLLVAKDGKMYVSARAKDIKYVNTNVAAKLNSIDTAIAEILDKIRVLMVEDLIVGDESDTILTKAVKNVNGGYTVTADVRLSSDESIKVGDGGIRANIDIEVDTSSNKLTLKVGNTEKTVTLPGVSIIDNIYYDAANKTIVITWKDGSQQTVIPVGDMLKTWIVVNSASSPVVLTKTEGPTSSDPEQLSANLKIAATDNLIGVNASGQLYVSESNINNKVAAEKSAREAADTDLARQIAAEATARHAADDELTALVNTTKEEIITRIDGDEERINAAYANAEEAKAQVELTNANLNAEISRAQTAEETNAAAINAEASRAQSAETSLANRATSLETNLTAEVNTRTANDATQNEKISNLETSAASLANRATALESGLAVESETRATADAVHDEKIANLAAGLENAEEARREDVEALSAQIHENADAIAVLNGSESTPGSVLEAVKGAKTYAETLAANEEARAREKETALETSINNEVSRAQTAEEQVLADSKGYTDHAIADAKVLSDAYTDSAKAEAIATSKAYTDEKVGELDTTSKAYTDEKVNAEKERALAAESSLNDAVTALQEKDAQIDVELAKKVEDVEIVKNGATDLQYILKVDGVDAGVIDIPKDKFLKSASYDAGNKELVFVFVTDEGEDTVRVNVADLVDTYTAGNGLVLENNQFSVKVNEDTEEYLVLTEEGLKITGVNAALAAKANAGDVYTKGEVDEKIDAIVIPDVSIYATKTEVAEEIAGVQSQVTSNTARIDSAENAITVINGNEAQEGSIKKALADAKAYTDTEVGAEQTRATAAEGALNDAIAIINGNEAQEGSIKKALADAKSYADSEVAGLSSSVDTQFAAVNETVANKANKSEVYTKAEIEAKGYLVGDDIANLASKAEVQAVDAKADANQAAITIINGNEAEPGSIKKALADAKAYTDTQVSGKANATDVYTKAEIEAKGYLVSDDIADLATKAEVNNEVARAQGVESGLQSAIETANSNIAANTSDITALQAESRRLNLIADETNTVKLTKSKDDNGTELAADVKLDATSTNILKVSGNGIYADVEMSYNNSTNTITFSNGLVTQEFQLAGASLLEDGYYNSSTKQIILITKLADGTTKNIVIDADALIHTLKVDNGTNNPIKLAKTTDSEGVDVLSARLDISTETHNLILNNNGTLYASNEAKNHTALWNGAEKTLQEVLELLKVEAEEGSEAAEEVAEIRTELNEVEREMRTVENTVTTLSSRVDTNTTDIATNRGAIQTLTTQVSDVNTRVTNLSNQFDTLSNEFDTLEETVNTFDGRIQNVESSVSNLNTTVSALNTRVEAVEGDVNDIQDDLQTLHAQLGDISGEKTVEQRLEYLEIEVENYNMGEY